MSDLDAFLAECDDVIADWEGSDDSATWAADGSHEHDTGDYYAGIEGYGLDWSALDVAVHYQFVPSVPVGARIVVWPIAAARHALPSEEFTLDIDPAAFRITLE